MHWHVLLEINHSSVTRSSLITKIRTQPYRAIPRAIPTSTVRTFCMVIQNILIRLRRIAVQFAGFDSCDSSLDTG